jgi:WD40 repeat protein
VAHEYAVYGVAFSPDGKTLASGSCDKTVKPGRPMRSSNTSTPSPGEG